MSQLLQELLRKAEQLSPEEQVQLIEHLVHRIKRQQQNKPKRKLSDFYGIAPNLLGGQDAQEWVNELRQEWQERENSLRKNQ
ncbi:MAG: hypothetical protein ACRC2S_04035 [Waterburya sp.]